MTILKFKEFITEEEQLHIDVDPEQAMKQLDQVNSDLETVTASPFMNSAVFMNAVRGTLERYGIILPPSYVMPTLSAEAETVYTLGETGKFLYICHNPNADSLIDGYAQIVDEEELDELVDMDKFADQEESLEAEYSVRKPWVPPARRDDDSGNNSEYA